MSLAQKYRKSLEKSWCLRFKTNLPDGDEYDGVITHNQRQYVVLREEQDFAFDGVLILPKRVIRGYRDDKHDRCCNAIIRENGAIKRAKVPRFIDSCETMSDVLAQLNRRDIWPGIEVLFKNGAETAFYLGPITPIDDETFHIRCYDAAGNWEKVYELETKEICRIEFDSQYCNSFNRYMRFKDGQKQVG